MAWVRVDGEIFAVPDLATLQRWVLEKRVLPDDRGSADGTTWSAIGDRPELGLFFEAADRLDRSSESAQHALLTMAHSEAEDVFADPTPPAEDGDVTVLPGGGDDVDDEPIAAGDDDDDLPGDEQGTAPRPSTSLSFSPEQIDLAAGDGGTRPRPAGAGPHSSGGTATVRIAPPALPEAVEDAPAAQAYAIAEAESERAALARTSLHEGEAAGTLGPLPQGGGVRLRTPPGAGRLGPASAPPVDGSPASMPDFHPHAPGGASPTDERGDGVPVKTPKPRAGIPDLAWFVLLVLIAAALVTALWMHGPTARHTRSTGQAEPPTRSAPLPPAVRPLPAPLLAAPPTPPAGIPAASTALPSQAEAPAATDVPDAPPPTAVPATPPPTVVPATPPPAASPAPAVPPAQPRARPTGRAAAKAGWDAVERERWNVASAAFDEILATDPANPWAVYGRAYVAERTGDLATARKAYCTAEKYAGSGDLARDIQAGARRVSADCPP